MLKQIVIALTCTSFYCAAESVPANYLQSSYKMSLDKQQAEETSYFSMDSVYLLPKSTYQYLNTAFSGIYQKLSFTTSITDNAFDESEHYEIVAVPLIASSNDIVQVEVFGNFSESKAKMYSNCDSDQAMSDYYANYHSNQTEEQELSLGAGISINTGGSSKLTIIISDDQMPGYGKSKALLGFETKF